jgi:hypothetical protein
MRKIRNSIFVCLKHDLIEFKTMRKLFICLRKLKNKTNINLNKYDRNET